MSFTDLCTWTMSVESIDDTAKGNRGGKRDGTPVELAAGIPCVIHDASMADVLAFSRANERITCRVQFEGPLMVGGTAIRLDTTHRIVATHDETGQVRTLRVKGEKIPVATSMPHVAHCEDQVR